MVVDVVVDFVFDAVQAGGNVSVVLGLSLATSMYKSNDNAKTAGNKNSNNPVIHSIRALELC
jgi:hypothetical protein